MTTNVNVLCHKLQAECGPEIVLAEAERIGMEFKDGSLLGTREQWDHLDYELHRKPSDPPYDPDLDLL